MTHKLFMIILTFLMLCIMFSSVNAVDTNQSELEAMAIAFYPMDNLENGVTLDFSPNGFNMSCDGGTLTTSSTGATGIDLEKDSAEYCTAYGDDAKWDIDYNMGITYFMWVEFESVGSGRRALFSKMQSGSDGIQMRINDDAAPSDYQWLSSTGADVNTLVEQTNSVNAGDLALFLGCTKESDMQLFKNASQVAEDLTFTGYNFNNDINFSIAKLFDVYTPDMDGIVWNIGILNESICNNQGYIDWLWNNGQGNQLFSGSVFEYPTPLNGDSDNIQININVSCNVGNITLWADNSTDPTTVRINNLPSPANWTSDFGTSGTKYYKASCNSGGINTTTRTFIYDIEKPQINLLNISFFKLDNTSNVSGVNINKNISLSLTDNIGLFAYMINITNSSGYEFYYFQNITLSGIIQNVTNYVNFSNWTNGIYNISITLLDPHTLLGIKDYEIDKKNADITFSTTEGNIISVKSNIDAYTATIKKSDRYEFEFDFSSNSLADIQGDKVFTISCNNELIYRPNSEYTAHFICLNGNKGNWIDFEGTGEISTVEKSGKDYTITFKNNKDFMKFTSIGGLNIDNIRATFRIMNLFPLNPYLEIGTPDGTREWEYTGEYNLKQNASMNITVINNIIMDGCVCMNCSIIGGNCKIPFTFHSDSAGTLKVNIINITYEFGIDNCSQSFGIPTNATTLNISFQTITGDASTVNVTTIINYFDEVYSNTQYEITELNYCIYPSWANISFTSSIQYVDTSSNNYYNYPAGYLNNITQYYIYYVTIGTEQTTFTLKDNVDKQKVIPNANCISNLFLNGAYTQLETKYSDIAGKIVFNYLPNNNYKFICSADNYDTYTFILNPITSATWDIFLTPSSTVSYSNYFDRISFNLEPSTYYEGANTFNFTILSFYGELTNYGYTLTYPGGSTSNSGTNAAGETLTSNINIVTPSIFDTVQLDISYTLPLFGTKTLTYHYPIGNKSSQTLINPPGDDPTYGMGLIERLLIVVLGSILIVGLLALVGQDLAGMALQLIWGGYWAYVKFVPLWALLPSIFIVVVVLSWRSR